MEEILKEIEAELIEIKTTGYGTIVIDVTNTKAKIESTTSTQLEMK